MNRGFMAALGVAVLVVAVAVLVVWKIQPSTEEQKEIALEGAVREGSPEFAEITKKIIIENVPDKTWESPLGTGYLMMNIAGRIKNYSGRIVSGLEIKTSVLDISGNPVKEKTVLVIPIQQAELAPGEVMDVVVRIDGFSKDDDRARIRWKVTAIKFKQ